ncbi:hypothetical protein BS78_01G503500 [Paspalum vaginatum]|nr:hypothetical protein BS78_01G503500 [Paspalum vaginatum]KAJ1299076.1 hypothetical protein BS78_01G503500 [Paspalum vaginatum]KAJ1299077.1 hypothetical protein BS78_01G503500 [Paspalum vaginatum]KAJ1299078.1 hypothetical protein BS78_01G503500 [Paspalum vaginatum]
MATPPHPGRYLFIRRRPVERSPPRTEFVLSVLCIRHLLFWSHMYRLPRFLCWVFFACSCRSVLPEVQVAVAGSLPAGFQHIIPRSFGLQCFCYDDLVNIFCVDISGLLPTMCLSIDDGGGPVGFVG